MLTSFYLEYQYIDGRSQIKVHTDKRHRLTAPSVPWQSPIQVLTGVDMLLNFSERATELALVATTVAQLSTVEIVRLL